MSTGVVYGVNSSMIVIGALKYFLGEQKAEGIEKGDTVEFENDANQFLTKLALLEKAGKPAATNPAPISSSPETDEKARKAGFGAPTTAPADPAKAPTKIQVPGLYFGHDKGQVMMQVNGRNNVYPATRELSQYLSSKDCKAVAETPAVLTIEDRQDGKGPVATGIGPAEGSAPAGSPAPAAAVPPANPAQPKPAAAAAPRQPAAAGTAPSFHRAVRKSAKLRVGLCGTSGSGKTFDSLLIAFGIGGPIALIDTENSSAELYAHLGEYDVCVLSAPFTAQKYTDAIHAAERAGYNVIIIDSLSHAWAGEGGLLDMKDNITKTSKSANSFTAWRDVTPLHRGLVDAMLQSPCHIIATMRSKTEYVLDVDDRGRTFPRKVGMAPVQREGMDYEFTLVFDIDTAHIATASKDRTSLFTGKSFQPSIETGRQLKQWLEGGA